MKKGFVSALVIAISVSSFASLSLAATKDCDNDPATSGCTATKFGTWTLFSSSTSKSQDYRGQLSSNQQGKSSSQYLYGLSSGLSSSKGLNFYAYLNTTNADCNYASYDTTAGNLTTLNQDTAPSGWSYLGNSTDFGAIPVSVYSNTPSGTLVADTIEISW